MAANTPLLRLWGLLTSLKLAIVLASAATALVMAGSVLMPFNPRTFASLDGMILSQWLQSQGRNAPALTWWIPLAGTLLLLLWLNTLCCFLDWMLHMRSRWRKTGEYLLHLGFVLFFSAYLWGSLAGFRQEGLQVFVGQTAPTPRPGLFVRVNRLEPLYNSQGRPMDMLTSLTLLQGDREVANTQARANHPLLWRGMVILPTSMGEGWVRSGSRGAQRLPYSVLTVNYDPGARIAAAGGGAMTLGVLLALVSFYRKRSRGERPDIL